MNLAMAAGGRLGRIPAFPALDARTKLVCFVGLAVVTVSHSATDHAGLAGCAVLGLLLAALVRVRPMDLLRRLLHLAPFLAMAGLLPFTRAEGGLAQALGESAQAMIGCLALVLLSATTPPDRILTGLTDLRCPAVVVLLLSMIIRYLHQLCEESQRMHRAAVARGYTPRSLLHVTALGHLIGALFLRSHARAERVHAAMLARGFTGVTVREKPAPLRLPDLLCIAGILGLLITWRLLRP